MQHRRAPNNGASISRKDRKNAYHDRLLCNKRALGPLKTTVSFHLVPNAEWGAATGAKGTAIKGRTWQARNTRDVSVEQSNSQDAWQAELAHGWDGACCGQQLQYFYWGRRKRVVWGGHREQDSAPPVNWYCGAIKLLRESNWST